jgi:hypothetical protein
MPDRLPGVERGNIRVQPHLSQPGISRATNTANSSRPRLPKFADLWAHYPGSPPYVDSKTKEPPKGYENQCSIKVGVALAKAGGKLDTFKGSSVRVDNATVPVRAQELAAWLSNLPYSGMTPAADITGADYEKKIKGRTGIIFYKDYWRREGESQPSGDHIDLWNGARLTMSGFFGVVVGVSRFTLGVQSGPEFSDLTKAKQILFWDVK